MKNPWEWTETDLLQLVTDRAQESISLEFKESQALPTTEGKRNEFSKDVSAFANSAGGTLVYGVVEDGHFATSLDTGSDPDEITKESIEQVINSTIQRRIDGIKIKQVALKNGRAAYTISVPQSNKAPHQARDKRFYKRYNFQSIAMEEYEIRDVAHRLEVPDLVINHSVKDNEISFKASEDVYSLPIEFSSIIVNNSPEPAHYAVIYLYFDKNLDIVSSEGMVASDNEAIVEGEAVVPVLELQKNWGANTKLPIFHVPYRVTDNPIKIRIKNNPRWREQKYLVGYKIESPRMVTKLHFDTLVIKNGFLVINEGS